MLFFFSGLHGDYHKPSDTWDKIDAPDAATAARPDRRHRHRGWPRIPSVRNTSACRIRRAHMPHRRRVGAGRSVMAPTSAASPISLKYRRVSSSPTYARFSGSKAGLKAGDILVEFDGKTNREPVRFHLRPAPKRVGDVVEVEVLRDNKPVRTKVQLAERK